MEEINSIENPSSVVLDIDWTKGLKNRPNLEGRELDAFKYIRVVLADYRFDSASTQRVLSALAWEDAREHAEWMTRADRELAERNRKAAADEQA
jgi:hypothetical protein